MIRKIDKYIPFIYTNNKKIDIMNLESGIHSVVYSEIIVTLECGHKYSMWISGYLGSGKEDCEECDKIGAKI
jgi:hypothetical protein